MARVFRRLLGVEHTVIESVDLVEERGEEMVIAAVRPIPMALPLKITVVWAA